MQAEAIVGVRGAVLYVFCADAGAVDDVDAVYEQVRSRVADLDPPVDQGFGTCQLNVRDPEGHE